MKNILAISLLLFTIQYNTFAFQFTSLGSFNGNDYFMSDNIATWPVASAAAIAEGGHLVSIESAAENEFLRSQIGTLIPYIGLSDKDVEGVFAWDNGEALVYDNVNLADNSNPADYVVLNFWDGSWGIVTNNVQKNFILEIEGGTLPSLDVVCQADTTFTAPIGIDSIIVDYPTPTATSNCGTISIVQTAGPTSGSLFPVNATTPITFSITLTCDADVIVEECNFNINVLVEMDTLACPDSIIGYTYFGEYDGHQYFISKEPHSWAEASQEAEEANGYLIKIESDGENDFIQNNIGTEMPFIGLFDSITEGSPIWSDSTELMYSNWDGNNSEDDDFGVFNFWDGSWSLYSGSVVKKSIIELVCIAVDEEIAEEDLPSIETQCHEDIFAAPANPGEFAIVFWDEPDPDYFCSQVSYGSSVQLISPTENGGTYGDGVFEIMYEITLNCGLGPNLITVKDTCSFFLTVNTYADEFDPDPASIGNLKSSFIKSLENNTQAINDNVVKLYPNPATNFIAIDFQNGIDSEETLLIYNSSGQVVKKQNIDLRNGPNQIRVDLSQIPKGLYFIQGSSSNLFSNPMKFIKL